MQKPLRTTEWLLFLTPLYKYKYKQDVFDVPVYFALNVVTKVNDQSKFLPFFLVSMKNYELLDN